MFDLFEMVCRIMKRELSMLQKQSYEFRSRLLHVAGLVSGKALSALSVMLIALTGTLTSKQQCVHLCVPRYVLFSYILYSALHNQRVLIKELTCIGPYTAIAIYFSGCKKQFLKPLHMLFLSASTKFFDDFCSV